jgi:uncharacterized cupredoxin-like copper-binding protein
VTLLRLAVIGALIIGGSAQAATSNRIPVVLTSFKFSPTAIELHAGMPVTLHIENASGGGHNFAAPKFFEAARIDPASARLIHSGRVEVPAHSSVDLLLTPAAGQYALKCSHTLHASFGMTGTILVR